MVGGAGATIGETTTMNRASTDVGEKAAQLAVGEKAAQLTSKYIRNCAGRWEAGPYVPSPPLSDKESPNPNGNGS